MQQELHKNPHYGRASVEHAPSVAEAIQEAQATEILDYGAGKGRLGEELKRLLPTPIVVHQYDPAIPKWSKSPAPCQFVACIDVLEHIEPHLIDNVLDHLQALTIKNGFFTIHTGPAKKKLSDGRNAHLIQKPMEWWIPMFSSRFQILKTTEMPNGFYIFVKAL